MSTLVFWQNIPSIHQAPLIREVARIWSGEVLVVTETDVPDLRLHQGWEKPDFAPATIVIAPDQDERRQLASSFTDKGAIHIFSGLHAYPETYQTLKSIIRTPATVGVFVESGRSNDGLKTILRRFVYSLHALRWGKHLDFILATGHISAQWYLRRGFPANRIYPFGYFVESPEDEYTAPESHLLGHSPNLYRLLYVGTFSQRKHLDLLLRALAGLQHRTWEIEIVGAGPLRTRLADLAEHLGIAGRVRWLGIRSNAEVRILMANASALVLPSIFDGWACVINESLMAGTPVIVSDACGASDLVGESWRGCIFRAGSIPSLREALNTMMHRGEFSPAERLRIKTWSAKSIAPGVAANYLVGILSHVNVGGKRPAVPWRHKNDSGMSLGSGHNQLKMSRR